jgi:hypothetical protein
MVSGNFLLKILLFYYFIFLAMAIGGLVHLKGMWSSPKSRASIVIKL